MTRQAFAKDPVTGRWGWTYIDLGPARVAYTRGTPIVPSSVQKATGNYGRKVIRGGAA